MKYFFSLLFLSLTGILTANAQPAVKLFNGTDLKGWYAFEPGAGKHADASEVFKVQEGMIRLYGDKTGYLMSEASFSDFELTAEFRWNTDPSVQKRSNSMNSGVMYLVPASTPDVLWPQGIQFQIKQGATGDFVLLKNVTVSQNGARTQAGESVVVARSQDAEKPAGEWNTLTVTVQKGKIVQTLNGTKVNEATEPSVDEGRILLQYEGFPIDFRKLEIRPIRK
jgi:hypothetical protein